MRVFKIAFITVGFSVLFSCGSSNEQNNSDPQFLNLFDSNCAESSKVYQCNVKGRQVSTRSYFGYGSTADVALQDAYNKCRAANALTCQSPTSPSARSTCKLVCR